MTWRKYVSLLMLPPTLVCVPFLMLLGSKLLLVGMAWEASMMFALGSLLAVWAVLLFIILFFSRSIGMDPPVNCSATAASRENV